MNFLRLLIVDLINKVTGTETEDDINYYTYYYNEEIELLFTTYKILEDKIYRVTDFFSAPEILIKNYSCRIGRIFLVKFFVGIFTVNENLRFSLTESVNALLNVKKKKNVVYTWKHLLCT